MLAPSPAAVLRALSIPTAGVVHELASGWWPGMPGVDVHPAFNVLTYRSPQGLHGQRDLPLIADDNAVGFSFVSELILSSTHSGTHIDALCHVTCGEDHTWHGGHSARTDLGDFGARSRDASELGPLIARGVLLDVAGHLGGERLPPGFEIDAALLQAAADGQGVALEPGDVVLVRTGQMRDWPDRRRMDASAGVGVSLDGARWLSRHAPAAVGADTASFESQPSNIPGDPQPVHLHLIREHGIPIMEWVRCETLAAAGAWTFLFLALPLTISGATGSMIRPVAVV